MTIQKIVVAMLIILGLAAPSPAVERSALEELLAFLPYGDFSRIEYINLAAGNAWDDPELFNQQWGDIARNRLKKELPKSLAAATTVRLRASHVARNIVRRMQKNLERVESAAARGRDIEQLYPNLHKAGTMWLQVYRIDGLEILLQEAVKNNHMVPVAGNENSSFYTWNAGDGQRSWYGATPMPGIFIAASDRDLVALMLAAGSGQTYSFIDNTDYNEVLVRLGDFGPLWEVTINLDQFFIYLGETNTEADQHMPWIRLRNWNLEKQVEETSVTIYLTEEHAEEAFADLQQPSRRRIRELPASYYDLQDQINGLRTYELDGNEITYTMTWSSALLEQQRTVLIDTKNRMMELEKEAAEHKK